MTELQPKPIKVADLLSPPVSSEQPPRKARYSGAVKALAERAHAAVSPRKRSELENRKRQIEEDQKRMETLQESTRILKESIDLFKDNPHVQRVDSENGYKLVYNNLDPKVPMEMITLKFSSPKNNGVYHVSLERDYREKVMTKNLDHSDVIEWQLDTQNRTTRPTKGDTLSLEQNDWLSFKAAYTSKEHYPRLDHSQVSYENHATSSFSLRLFFQKMVKNIPTKPSKG